MGHARLELRHRHAVRGFAWPDFPAVGVRQTRHVLRLGWFALLISLAIVLNGAAIAAGNVELSVEIADSTKTVTNWSAFPFALVLRLPLVQGICGAQRDAGERARESGRLDAAASVVHRSERHGLHCAALRGQQSRGVLR